MLSSTKEQIKQQQAGPASLKRVEPLYIFVAKILAFQLLAIFVVELSLSLAGLGEEEIFKLDPVQGFKHMSNKKVTWRSEGFATSYFDADGMREHGLTVNKPAGTFRVALLGDSLTESLQVPLEQSFAYQIQKSVASELSRPVQVLNFGVSGYSTVQEYLQLKQQVLKYKPDLVLVCYNNRDCFENWSPPDEVLTNVRPAALHLPGRKLIIDTSPVTQWMGTPRARFLKRVEFLREKSRLWGLFSAAELDWSLHNEAYKHLLFFATRPGKAIRQSMSELKSGWQETCNKMFRGGKKLAKTGTNSPLLSENKVSPPAPVPDRAENQLSWLRQGGSSIQNSSPPKAANPGLVPKSGGSTYEQLIVRTLASLFAEMNASSNSSGARFAVVALPSRPALSVKPGMETTFNGYDFDDEVKMLKVICKEKGIDFINVYEDARSLSAPDKESLFFLMHFTPEGHQFVARQLAPAVKDYVERVPQQ